MLDLSALDAELDGLGRVPEHVTSLARGFAGITLSGPIATVLAQVDAELSALSNGEYRAPAAQRAPSEALPSGVVRVESAQRAAEEAEAWREPEPAAPPPAAFESEPARAQEAALSSASEDTLVGDSLPPPQHEESGAFAQMPAATRSGSLTESQEIVLPDPIAREELSSESGELSLSGSDPSSGSFELPDSPTEPRIVSEDVDGHGSARAQDAAAARASDTSREPLMPFDDVQDALEGSQPIALSTRATLGPSAELDRDPDAEFDALLSEATDPRGIPTGGLSGEEDTDDLLRGLEGEYDDEATETPDDHSAHEADLLTRSLYEDSSENTDILDRETLGAIEDAAKSSDTRPDAEEDELDASLASLMSPDELDSGELEIIDDEPTIAPQPFPPSASMATPTKPVPPPKAPAARPGLSNKAPPPPPPSSGDSKRPSFLGRLFTKREGE